MSKPPRAKYRTTNWSEYNEVLKRRGSLMAWIDADLQWQA
ncbi:MAG: IS5/IS1182 family transposase, partial [Comamonas sp.]